MGEVCNIPDLISSTPKNELKIALGCERFIADGDADVSSLLLLEIEREERKPDRRVNAS